MDVPVEDFREGDRVTLRNGRTVRVDKISRYPDGDLVVRWSCGPILQAAHKLAGERDQLGSFAALKPGKTVAVESLVTALERNGVTPA